PGGGVRDAAVHAAVDAVVHVVGVQREAHAIAAVVDGHRAQLASDRLAVDGRAAAAAGAVDAHAPWLALAEAPADVHRQPGLRIRGVAGGQAPEGLVLGALGHDVDAPAHRAARRLAVEHAAGPAQDLH